MVVVALAGCGSYSEPVRPPQSGKASHLFEAPPNEVSGVTIPEGQIARAVSALDGLANQLMADSGIPGMAVAVVHGGKTVYANGFGVKDVRNGNNQDNKVDADTVFQLASVSKSVGATVVAHEVTDNVVSWDTPVASKLPWFALSDPYVTDHVTIADLYSHRSGLPDHAGDELEDLGYDRDQVLRRLKYLPLSPFRITYDYTNFGLTVAAEAVATAAGKPWADLCQEVLYRPLGMTSTSSRYVDFAAAPNHVVSHVKVGDTYEARYQREPDPQSPAGGVSSSVVDMARWLSMVLANGTYDGRQIASPEALLPTNTAQIVSQPAASPKARAGFYGHGFNVSVTSSGRTAYSHSGAFGLGAATTFVVLPSEDVGIVALTNAAPVGVPETLAAQFMDLVQYGEVREDWPALYKQIFDSMTKPEGSLVGKQPPADPAPAKPLSDYVGQYANDYWGPAKVDERDAKLHISMGPHNQTFDLTHWDGDTFTFTMSDENAPPGSISKATFNDNTLTLEYYDKDHLGTFTR